MKLTITDAEGNHAEVGDVRSYTIQYPHYHFDCSRIIHCYEPGSDYRSLKFVDYNDIRFASVEPLTVEVVPKNVWWNEEWLAANTDEPTPPRRLPLLTTELALLGVRGSCASFMHGALSRLQTGCESFWLSWNETVAPRLICIDIRRSDELVIDVCCLGAVLPSPLRVDSIR